MITDNTNPEKSNKCCVDWNEELRQIWLEKVRSGVSEVLKT